MKTRRICILTLLAAGPCIAGEFADTRTLEHGLREHPVVLVNSQGLAQHDLSIRGSSYAGAGISLNGLQLKTPYSSHFNADMPFLSYLVSRPQASYGLDNVSGHLVGTARYETTPQAWRLQASGGVGTPEQAGITALGQVQAGDAAAGLYGDFETANEIDHDANALDRYAGGLHAQWLAGEWMLDAIGGHQRKEFGAQGYYGIPQAQYAEQQIENSLLYVGARKGELDDAYIRGGAAFRQVDDRYSTTGSGHDVRSRFGALMAEGRTLEIQHMVLNVRGDLEHEDVGGSIVPADRTRASLLLLPEARFARLTFKAGVNSVIQTSESTEFLPQAGIDWYATDNSVLYASYAENIQQPDFQTLESNPLLEQQQVRNSELGLRQYLSANLDWRVAGFYRRLDHASDWIGGTAVNLGNLDITGLDSAVSYYPSGNLELRAYYQWLSKDSATVNGLYETDYPEHLLNVAFHWRFMPEFMLFGTQDLRYQTENILRTSSDLGVLASLGLHYDPRFAKNTRLTFRVDNLWGSDFQVIPGLKPRPASAFAGITVAW